MRSGRSGKSFRCLAEGRLVMYGASAMVAGEQPERGRIGVDDQEDAMVPSAPGQAGRRRGGRKSGCSRARVREVVLLP
jgi:hypothetical protein